MAGRLNLKGCFNSEEDLGISRGYNKYSQQVLYHVTFAQVLDA